VSEINSNKSIQTDWIAKGTNQFSNPKYKSEFLQNTNLTLHEKTEAMNLATQAKWTN